MASLARGGGQSRKTESRWWFLCLRCLERCGRAWEARLFISREGGKGSSKGKFGQEIGKGIKEFGDEFDYEAENVVEHRFI
jgi:hypothetical protein